MVPSLEPRIATPQPKDAAGRRQAAETGATRLDKARPLLYARPSTENSAP
jgi:hypothetical protein